MLFRFAVFFAFIFCALLYASPCTAKVDGVEVTGNCKGVLKNGRFIGYHRNGMPVWVVHFKNDVLHGRFTRYYPNGNIHLQGTYKNGKLWGDYTQYNYDNYMLKAKFKHGVLHDWLYTYDVNKKKLEALKFYYGKIKLQKYID